jgi:hypothetical protein
MPRYDERFSRCFARGRFRIGYKKYSGISTTIIIGFAENRLVQRRKKEKDGCVSTHNPFASTPLVFATNK